MSRVYEARRRAADLARDDGADEVHLRDELKPLPSFDARKPTIEAFPCETSVRGASRSSRTHQAPSLLQYQLVPALPVLDRRTQDTAPVFADAELPTCDPDIAFKLVGNPEMPPAFREQYRSLAATLHNAQTAKGIAAIMIASAVSGEGKSLTAANLALTFSQSYQRRVLLVDADLRRPSLHQLFRFNNSPGLTDALASAEDRGIQARQVTQLLAVLSAGSGSSPMAVLSSERMRRLLQEARKTFDWIIIDTPPVALLPDASLLASMVDGAVIVVKAESTPLELVQRAVSAIGSDKTLGFVLNAARHGPSRHDYDYESPPSVTPTTPARPVP